MPYAKTYQGFRDIGQGLGMLTSALLSRNQRRDEQEKKGIEEQRKLYKDQLALLEKHRPSDPRIDVLVDALLKSGGMPGGEIPQRMGQLPFPALGQDRPIRTPQVREAFIETGAERAKALAGIGEERVTEITTAKREEKATLRKRAEQLMKQRRDFLRGDPIMTALGGLIEPQWSDDVEGAELTNILSDLRLRHKFNYPKSVMNALKLPAQQLGPPRPVGEATPTGATLGALQRPQFESAVAATTGQAISIPEYINPETGERIRWDGTRWVKVE